ncbi:hypothetical protein F4V72_23030 [Salmonella enterica subsp. diarizonae]|uniref:Uncharacterized protein n=1 Tax=Salmonella diarizonae TaxID=59204 RepID=A0A379TQZ1_SALDZ|nr:hypothetical protein [Salmonella enterica]ECH9341530.1 hypothetical protein [Salmonella enterica subsp. diarizonae]EDU9903099.1 hypothetical protein [Salmonella enterica subsp. diarizonae]KAA8683729.1 hypothetical protein F4V72_23030 [Salmonella enterica subsp. diarizonae]SUG53002.1 Uncharacterised protein [Salmonella enterica subsp. diarizonae]VFS91073.1 Uncharacterised protein [Salmonella enterica subsp. diarizonae]
MEEMGAEPQRDGFHASGRHSVKHLVYRIPRPAPFLSVFLTGIYFRLNFLSSCFYWFCIIGASRCGTLAIYDWRRDRKRIHSVSLKKIFPRSRLRSVICQCYNDAARKAQEPINQGWLFLPDASGSLIK